MSMIQQKMARAPKHAAVSNTILNVLNEAASLAQEAGVAFDISNSILKGEQQQVTGSTLQLVVGQVAHELEVSLPLDEVKIFTSRAGEAGSNKTILGMDAFTPTELASHILKAFSRHDALTGQAIDAAQKGTAFLPRPA